MSHAIVGCGRVAPNHVYGTSEAGEELKWCCDMQQGRAEEFAATHGIQMATSNFDRVLDDPEVTSISVCTDHGSHARLAVSALEAGKHVIIEKPLAISVDEIGHIIDAQNRSGLLVSVCFQHRFDPLVMKIKKIIDDGSLGNITAINASIQCSKTADYYNGWRGKIATEGGSTLINQGIHTLDLLVWFFGRPAVKGSSMDALKFAHDFETEDTLAATFRFPNGALGTFLSTNTSVVNWESYIEIIGTNGRLMFTTDFPNILLHCDIQDAFELEEELRRLSGMRNAPPPSMSYYGISHKECLSNFFRAIRGQEKLFITAKDGIQTQAVVEEIYNQAHRAI